MIEVKGPRVTLRTMTREAYHAARRAYVPDPMMDPGPYVYDAGAVDAAYERMRAQAETYPRAGIFVGESIIGELSFKRVDRAKGRCELGIALSNDAHKGKGYGSEAFSLAARYAFETLGLRTVYADTMGSNLRMRRILDRLGFRLYLRTERCYDMGDRMEDRLDYALTREAWAHGYTAKAGE